MRTNNLKSIRERIGLSQSAFAEEIDVSQGNVSHYECQRQEVPPEVARRVIAAASRKGLSISFDDIYLTPVEAANQEERRIGIEPGQVLPERRSDQKAA